ncbi:1-acyl-sn-glycerol-3-phosphate acyltransferase [Kribbella sandramycini]|uniref:1-acyl-sn-glycerol-3-phosphate acyltransferase n=1 Tax=Kribbella sandramycini TaxID=60450 RepID=A0A7Y4KXS6_9ACTN|nr:lysophospholipid acyltransferase family protein [Kribbella sandramycini]MBB6569539.1 1-acyl-sn-glycerol-3-phosphate acyltransferase [Kribbella sandramycini]NOL40627.1 1-acyl-sn-glycerol-3-phosphate acyltransferase [Kribbella sandramycini]
MTAELTGHRDLPRTDDVRPMPYRLGLVVRAGVRAYFGRRYEIVVHREELFPRVGPVLMTPNHLSLLDGPLLGAISPRMLHQLAKIEAFGGLQGQFLHRVGQIAIDRSTYDNLAIRKSIRVLRDGRVLNIYPEGTRGAGDFGRIRLGAAYLAMVTGAPILPVALLGTRLPGGDVERYPPAGSRIDVVYGEPFTVDRVSFPRRHSDVRAVADQIGDVLRAHVQAAVAATGHPLPGAPDKKDPDD